MLKLTHWTEAPQLKAAQRDVLQQIIDQVPPGARALVDLTLTNLAKGPAKHIVVSEDGDVTYTNNDELADGIMEAEDGSAVYAIEELEDFVEAIRSGRAPTVRGEDGRLALALATRVADAISRQKQSIDNPAR